MKPQILTDAKSMPRLFLWEGPVEPHFLSRMLAENGWSAPNDLFEFWVTTGGGEIFESEALLAPHGRAELGENLITANHELRQSGLPPGYMAFHTGLEISAVRLSDGMYVRLDPEDFHEVAEYTSFDDWYRHFLRKVYAEVYGLK